MIFLASKQRNGTLGFRNLHRNRATPMLDNERLSRALWFLAGGRGRPPTGAQLREWNRQKKLKEAWKSESRCNTLSMPKKALMMRRTPLKLDIRSIDWDEEPLKRSSDKKRRDRMPELPYRPPSCSLREPNNYRHRTNSKKDYVEGSSDDSDAPLGSPYQFKSKDYRNWNPLKARSTEYFSGFAPEEPLSGDETDSESERSVVVEASHANHLSELMMPRGHQASRIGRSRQHFNEGLFSNEPAKKKSRNKVRFADQTSKSKQGNRASWRV